MAKFNKKPVVVEATQWYENGDHPEDNRGKFTDPAGLSFLGEGKIVRYYRAPNIVCQHCGGMMHDHGWIDTFEGGHIVCPGDWIITGVKGERYPCKPDVFAETYEEVKPGD